MKNTTEIDLIMILLIIFGGSVALMLVTNITGAINAECTQLGTITSIESENVVTLDNHEQYVISSYTPIRTGLQVEECIHHKLFDKESVIRVVPK